MWTRSVAEVVVVLGVGVVGTIVALVVTIRMVTQTRRDLRWVRRQGYGNGRLAAARGECTLAISRLVEALLSALLTGSLFVVAATAPDQTSDVPPVWLGIVLSVAAIDFMLAFKAVKSRMIRARIIRLGIVDINEDHVPQSADSST